MVVPGLPRPSRATPKGLTMRVVVDTNVVLTAAFDVGSVPSLLAYERARLTQIMPTAGWHEARRIAREAAARTGVDPAVVDRVLDLYKTSVGLQLVPTRPLGAATAGGFDAQFEAVALGEQVDAICTFNGRDFKDSEVPALSPLAVLRTLDFEKYAIAIPALDGDEGCFFADLVWQDTAGRSNAWLLRGGDGRRFGIDPAGNWSWSDGSAVDQTQPLIPSRDTKLLVGWNPDILIVWAARGGDGFIEQARSQRTLIAPVAVEFIMVPDNGWRMQLRSMSGAPVFPTPRRRRTILRDSGVDSTYASVSAEDLVAGCFMIEGADDMTYLKFDQHGHRRPGFGHKPSAEPDHALNNFTWMSLLPGFEHADLVHHDTGDRFTLWNGQWTKLL